MEALISLTSVTHSLEGETTQRDPLILATRWLIHLLTMKHPKKLCPNCIKTFSFLRRWTRSVMVHFYSLSSCAWTAWFLIYFMVEQKYSWNFFVCFLLGTMKILICPFSGHFLKALEYLTILNHFSQNQHILKLVWGLSFHYQWGLLLEDWKRDWIEIEICQVLCFMFLTHTPTWLHLQQRWREFLLLMLHTMNSRSRSGTKRAF